MSTIERELKPGGTLGLSIIRGSREPAVDFDLPTITKRGRLDLSVVERFGLPGDGMSEEVARWRAANRVNLERGLRRVLAADEYQIPTHLGALFVSKLNADGSVVPYGLASLRVVTDTGVAAIVDAFTNTFELENFNFHGMGTGVGAEAVGNTALGTELTTEYNPNSTRATGTQSQPSANVYRTVGTNTIDSGTPAVTEHGIFSQAATGGGVMIDRSVFAAINLAASDGIQFTYDLTFTSGG